MSETNPPATLSVGRLARAIYDAALATNAIPHPAWDQLDAAEIEPFRTMAGLVIERLGEQGASPADVAELAELDREGAELVCVDECGFCDACGMEPFGTPAEGWREAARFLRRTPRESADFLGAIRGARLIETELRRMADEAQQPETRPDKPPTVCEGFVWIGQSFATCDRCPFPAWEHAGRDAPIEGAVLGDTRRTVIPWEPGEADRIRAKWGPGNGPAS